MQWTIRTGYFFVLCNITLNMRSHECQYKYQKALLDIRITRNFKWPQTLESVINLAIHERLTRTLVYMWRRLKWIHVCSRQCILIMLTDSTYKLGDSKIRRVSKSKTLSYHQQMSNFYGMAKYKILVWNAKTVYGWLNEKIFFSAVVFSEILQYCCTSTSWYLAQVDYNWSDRNYL